MVIMSQNGFVLEDELIFWLMVFWKSKPYYVGINNASTRNNKIVLCAQDSLFWMKIVCLCKKDFFLQPTNFIRGHLLDKNALFFIQSLSERSHDFSFLSWGVFCAEICTYSYAHAEVHISLIAMWQFTCTLFARSKHIFTDSVPVKQKN